MKLSGGLYCYPEEGMFDCNTYIIKGQTNMIVDTGSAGLVPILIKDMAQDGIEPEDIGLICNTHLHLDHCGANQAFKDASGARIMLHPLQKKFFDLSVYDVARVFGFEAAGFREDACFTSDNLGEFGLDWEMIPSPGHSAESICFYSKSLRCLLSGDLIFAGNIGRYDLPGGDPVALGKSIRNIAGLDVEWLLPGHMEMVRGADRVKANYKLVQSFLYAEQ